MCLPKNRTIPADNTVARGARRDLEEDRSQEDHPQGRPQESLTLISMLARGVDVSPIADVPKLKSLFCQDGDWLKGVRALKKTLTARGVKVTP